MLANVAIRPFKADSRTLRQSVCFCSRQSFALQARAHQIVHVRVPARQPHHPTAPPGLDSRLAQLATDVLGFTC